MVKVSVIIPVFNVEDYLKQCLDSVVHQTLKDIEIICVNDSSTDKSLDILEEYAKTDWRIRVITQPNAGAGAARNKGMDVATGKYLAFLDSDDFFELNMLEKAYEMAEDEQSDLVVYKSDQYHTEDNRTGRYNRRTSHLHQFLETELQSQRKQKEDDTNLRPCLDIIRIYHRRSKREMRTTDKTCDNIA